MQRVRRLASIAVTVSIGVLVLTGCRSEPGVAAYVGDHSYSQNDVDQVIDQIKDQVPPERRAELRSTVVRMIVLRDAAADYAEANSIFVPATDPTAFAQQQGLPPNTRFTELAAGYLTTLGAVQQSASSAAPTEADQREAHSHATLQGQPVTDEFETVRQFFDEKQIGKAVGIRNLLNTVIEQADVSLNPRYGELIYQVPVQIGQATSWLAVPLTEKDTVVSDVTARS